MRKILISLVLTVGIGVNSFAQITNFFIQTNVCENDSVTLTSGSFVAKPEAIVLYEWDFDNNGTFDLSGPDSVIKHVFTSFGDSAVTLRVTTNLSYTSSVTNIVKVDPNPIAVASFPATGCVDDPVIFNGTGSSVPLGGSIKEFIWDFDDGSATVTGSTVSYSYASANSFLTPSFQVISNNNCTTTVASNLNMAPRPTASFIATVTCLGDSTIFVNTSTKGGANIRSSSWFFNDPLSGTANNITTSGTATVTHLYSNTGTYGDTLIVIDGLGCIDTVIQTDSVVVPLQTLSITSTSGSIIFEGKTTTLGTSDSYANYSWSSGEITPTIVIDTSGIYKVSVTDASGCSLSSSITVKEIQANIVAKNLITPNADGKNDVWKIDDLSSFSFCNVEIYNRWGRLVYYSDNYANDWDGTFNSAPLPEGVYFYTVSCPDEEIGGTGSITLLR